MAITQLPTDFVDAVTSQYKYQVTDVGNDEALFDDVSEYSTYGTPFGASEINAQHKAINDAIDLEESIDADITKIKNGTTVLSHVEQVGSVPSATTATHADRAGSVNNDIVINEQTLTFTNKVCTIQNANVTAKSLANVIFSRDTLDVARKSVISVETSAGAITLTAGRTPNGTIKARIEVRVV